MSQFVVIGGDLVSIDEGTPEFKNLQDMHFVGAFGTHEKAREAWKANAQATVDNAHRRYFIVDLGKALN